MSYSIINSNEIETGKPVSSATQTKIKENFENHESRIVAIETGSTTVYPPLIFRVDGFYGIQGAITNLLKTTMNFNLTITGVRILIDVAGVSGTTEIDLLFKRGGGAWTSLLTTTPSVAYSSGSDYLSNNAVLDPTKVDLEAGDILRLDTLSVQNDAQSFLVRVDYNKT